MNNGKLHPSSTIKLLIKKRRKESEAGDTLIEVLVTLVVISLCVVSFLVAFTTAITASAKHRTFVSLDTVLRTVSENTLSQIELQANPLFVACAVPSTYQNLNFGVPTGYSATITSIEYWNGSSFITQCSSGSTTPQLINISVTNSLAVSTTISVVVDDPAYSTNYANTASQITFSSQQEIQPPSFVTNCNECILSTSGSALTSPEELPLPTQNSPKVTWG